MQKLMWFVGGALLTALGAVSLSPVAATPAPADLGALSWLAGEWRGKAGSADVVSWHSDPAGGMIVMATKELEGGKLRLFDFGVVAQRNDAVTYVPYPYGKASVAFTLVDFDPTVEKAVFANDSHDFPKRFVFERVAGGHLWITLSGDEGGTPAKVEYELAPTAAMATKVQNAPGAPSAAGVKK